MGSDGSIGKQDFWKIKRVLAPKCNTVPHCIVDSLGMRSKMKVVYVKKGIDSSAKKARD